MTNLTPILQETLKAVQDALHASQREADALRALSAELGKRLAQERLDRASCEAFIAQQDQLIRFQSQHVPADLVYPEPFDRMIQARRAN